MMDYQTFLERIIDDGIKAASETYKNKEEHRNGAVAGFNACRNLDPDGLRDLYITSNEYVRKAMKDMRDDYWHFRCYQLEVEWVCNVVSAMLINQGMDPILTHLPTGRGFQKAADIIGVAKV